MSTYHAIQIIGYGRNARYCIKRVELSGPYSGPLIVPVDRKAYRTELDARDAADRMGLFILKVGDLWQII